MIVADPDLLLTTTHAAALIASDGPPLDFHPADLPPLLGKGNLDPHRHVGRAADHIIDRIASVHFQQMQFFGVRVLLHGYNLAHHHILNIPPNMLDFFHLRCR